MNEGEEGVREIRGMESTLDEREKDGDLGLGS